MKQNLKNELIQLKGMTCINCEHRIETALKNIKGIVHAKANYTNNTVYITYDANVINFSRIQKVMEETGYQIIKTNEKVHDKNKYVQIAGILLLILALQTIIGRIGGFQIFNYFPRATEGMAYGMLFIIGVLTSVHCIAMCGGINLSQCASYTVNFTKRSKLSDFKPSFLYNLGRIISYTVIGGIVGSLGSVVSLSGTGKGIITLIAGGFMIIMGLNMLNIFPWLRNINPHMPKFFALKINEQKKSNRPLYIGLLNGLMPCGPLQAMQIYALSTGSPIKGAISMFLFSLGTVPLMFCFGAASSILTKKFTGKMMTFSAVLVIFLGICMFQNGMVLSGYSMPFGSKISNRISELFKTQESTTATAEIVDGQQLVTTTLSSRGYEPITVQTGIPVKWTIQANSSSINGCNNEIIIPEYEIQKELVPGDNVIEFTPKESGTISYSCWMGMIRSQIFVYDNLDDQSQVLPKADTSQLPSCCN